MKNVLIVESPNKIKKLSEYLGEDWVVKASVGHVRDLVKSGEFRLGVDWETVTPTYKIMKDKEAIVEDIKEAVEGANEVYLAMDPDREGEAIAWHLMKALELEDKDIKRITFNEITKDAIYHAIRNPRGIDSELVHAQESRRVLDRVVGFRLSNLVYKKTKARSAGRVQSAVLKIIVDREHERNAFVPDRWWTLEAKYKKNFHFMHCDEKGHIHKVDSEKELSKIMKNLSEEFVIESFKESTRNVSRPKPLEMSSYLSGMFSNYGMSNAAASLAIQKLYEHGHSSYPRTDSIRISSKEFLDKAEKQIKSSYGEKMFLKLDDYKSKKKRKASEQDAHEAKRPTNIENTPEKLVNKISTLEMKAYKFIWKTTMQAMMINGTNESKKYTLDNKGYKFTFSTSKTKVPGYRILNDETKESIEHEKMYESFFKIFEENKETKKPLKIKKNKIETIENETKPPGRYTQASLIKKLKETGIGRPSTYAPTTKILFGRRYVISQGSSIVPTELGELVSKKLDEQFSDIINDHYTAEVEETFDHIAHGDIDYRKFLKEYYVKFQSRVEQALETMEIEILPPRYTENKCIKCKSKMELKFSGMTGKDFERCSNFPECKYIWGDEHKKEPLVLEEACPECGKNLLIRFHREKGPFKACSNFPKCKRYGTSPITEVEIKILEDAGEKDQLQKFYDNTKAREERRIAKEKKAAEKAAAKKAKK